MVFDKLFKPGNPCFYLVTTDIKEFDFLSSRLIYDYKNAVIRTIRGKKSRTVPEFFNEVAAALQFPLYFGENWNAFNDCVNDLEWAAGEAYILLVSDAPYLLSHADSEDFRILIKMLSIANEAWVEPNKYIDRGRPVTPFHVVFQCSIADVSAFSDRLSQAGAEFDNL
jgi:hypothetical protein